MNYLKVGAVSLPEHNRVKWIRETLIQAKQLGITPEPIPNQELEQLTVALPGEVSAWICELAEQRSISVASITAGLIHSLHSREIISCQNDSAQSSDALLTEVRQVLHPLAKTIRSVLPGGKIAFCEAATGTGKGRLLMYLALKAIAEEQQVVVSAPIPVMRQLIEELGRMTGGRDISLTVLLGRPNFVSPDALTEWAQEASCQPVLDWIADGAPPRSPAVIELGRQMGVELSWLLDEALLLDDTIPPESVMLSEETKSSDNCPAEQIYAALKSRAENSSLVFCSHHLLAFHCLKLQMKAPSPLSEHIDLLLVDEAHLLEQAFSSIFSHILHLRSLARIIERSTATHKRRMLDALADLNALVSRYASGFDGMKTLAELKGMKEACDAVLEAIDAMSTKKNDRQTIRSLDRARSTLTSAVSGATMIRLHQTPVKAYPLITVGQANLDKPLALLWKSVTAAALVSATLYTTESKAGLMRWKLAIPKERAEYIPPVIPDWVTAPVKVMPARVPIYPDESSAWHDAVAERIEHVAEQAKGGTLVLATAYATLEALHERLAPILGDRLIVQSAQKSTSVCASQFRSHGSRPVWLGVGAAWTGIDLSDKAVEAGDDWLLSDEVICRLPFGANQTLTHQRRVRISGQSVVVQEALWVFRQGIGRLVRREGVPERKLWVLDCRLDDKASWMSPFRTLLNRYRKY